jgi:hypothetical protein
MNRQEIFKAWKRRREQIEVPRDFSAKVMTRLQESRLPGKMPDRVSMFLSRMAMRPWAKAAIVVVGVSLGLARILMTLQLILLT